MPHKFGLLCISSIGNSKKSLEKRISVYYSFRNRGLVARRGFCFAGSASVSNLVFCTRLASFSLVQLYDINSLQHAAGFFECATYTLYRFYFWPLDVFRLCKIEPRAVFIHLLDVHVAGIGLDAVDDALSMGCATEDLLERASGSPDQLRVS